MKKIAGAKVHNSAAQSYLNALKQSKSVLLVAPTWAEIEAVTEKVRAMLKSSGRLGADETEVQVFDSLSWTEAQKRDAQQYRPGLAIQWHRSKGVFNKYETLEAVAIGNDSIRVRDKNGVESVFTLRAGSACFDVGEKRKLRVAAGDKLLLQANAVAARQRFVNGELVEVKAIQGDSILLADGRMIPANYRSFTHGYAVTSHASQGKTVDEVFVVASARSLPAISQEQFYVSISRGRDTCRVFTDDKDLVRSHVTRSSARLSAIEVMPPARRHLIQAVLQRGHRFLKRLNLFRRASLSPRMGIKQTPSYEQQSTRRISL